MMTPHQRCVLQESVYNVLSLGGRDQTVREVANVLRARWCPAWDDVESVVTPDSVRGAGEAMQRLGLVELDGDTITIPVRDPQTRQGRPVRTDYAAAKLAW